MLKRVSENMSDTCSSVTLETANTSHSVRSVFLSVGGSKVAAPYWSRNKTKTKPPIPNGVVTSKSTSFIHVMNLPF